MGSTGPVTLRRACACPSAFLETHLTPPPHTPPYERRLAAQFLSWILDHPHLQQACVRDVHHLPSFSHPQQIPAHRHLLARYMRTVLTSFNVRPVLS